MLGENGMTLIRNSQNITAIRMKPTAITRCVIGGDWYTNRLDIIFRPDRFYPDYMEIQSWIQENIDGKDMNIEDVVSTVRSFLEKEYEPNKVIIIDHVKGCKTHFDVDVIG